MNLTKLNQEVEKRMKRLSAPVLYVESEKRGFVLQTWCINEDSDNPSWFGVIKGPNVNKKTGTYRDTKDVDREFRSIIEAATGKKIVGKI